MSNFAVSVCQMRALTAVPVDCRHLYFGADCHINLYLLSICVNACCIQLMCRALRADRRNESKGSKVRVPGSMFSECRDVRTHQHSAQGRWVQALSELALSFVTVLLRRHLHVPHRHSNSGFSLPRVSVRATALKMLNNVDLLVESVNGADAVRWVCLFEMRDPLLNTIQFIRDRHSRWNWSHIDSLDPWDF